MPTYISACRVQAFIFADYFKNLAKKACQIYYFIL